MVIITIAIGIDIGGNIKFSGMDKQISIPNIIGVPNVGWTGISTDKSWINNLILVEDDQEYYTGNLAKYQSEIKQYITEHGSLEKIDEVFRLIKAVLPLISDENNEDLVLGIGIPISTRIENMKSLSTTLKGNISIKIKNDATKEELEVSKNIKKVLVMPESYGTYYNVVSKFEGQRAKDAVIISLDLLTEIMTIYEGNLMRRASRNLSNASLFVLANKISIALQQQVNKIISPLSLLENIRSDKNEVVISGKMYDISKIKEHYIRQIAQEIVNNLTEAISFLPHEAEIEYYIISGEGVPIFWNEIEMLILENQLIEDLDKIIITKNPSFSNALGFELMAKKKIENENL
ncbi:MAG: hypothetical protein ACTSPY_17035 [Candidatus Helarchaeota archaeon]